MWLSFNQAPDVLVKAAFDPGWGHYEIFGIGGFAHETVYPGETTNSNLYGGITDVLASQTAGAKVLAAPALTTAGSYSNSIKLGGIGGSLRVPLVGRSSAWMGSVTSSGVRDRSARLSPLPRRDASGRIHHRGPHHPPHPRPPRSLGSRPRPGSRSATCPRRGSRSTLSPMAARPDACVPPHATGRGHVSATFQRAEIRLMFLGNRSETAPGSP